MNTSWRIYLKKESLSVFQFCTKLLTESREATRCVPQSAAGGGDPSSCQNNSQFPVCFASIVAVVCVHELQFIRCRVNFGREEPLDSKVEANSDNKSQAQELAL